MGEPTIMMRGIPGFDNDDFIEDACATVKKAMQGALDAHKGETNRAKKVTRDALSKFLWNRAHRRPVIMPVVIEI